MSLIYVYKIHQKNYVYKKRISKLKKKDFSRFV